MRVWIAMLAGVSLSLATPYQGPAMGKLRGHEFRPDRVELKRLGLNTATSQGKVTDRAQAYTLTFREGKGFWPDREVQVWFALDVGTKLEGYRLRARPFAFGTEGHRTQAFPKRGLAASVGRGVTGVHATVPKPGSEMGDTDIYNDRIDAEITFGRRQGNRLAGRIVLVLPNGRNSYLTGTFWAVLTSN